MKVIVTGAGALLGQGILRSLADIRPEVELVAVDPSPLSAGLYWAKGRALIPFANDPSYVGRIEALLDEHRPHALIPGTDVELSIFAKHRAAWEERFRTHVVVCSPEVVAIADDKYLTFQFMRKAGFDAPESCLPGEEEALIAKVGFPLIVKPRIGARSVGVNVARDRAELARAIASVQGPVIQELIATDKHEYTAGAIVFDGECHATIVMRRDLRDGTTYRAFVEDHPALRATVARVAEALGAHGPVNFQFRLDGDRVRVFEINARFSGTTPLRKLAGFNEVEMVLAHLVNGAPVIQPKIEPMTILRYWTEQVVRPDELVKAT